MQIFANTLLVITALCYLSVQLEAAKYNGNAMALIKNSGEVFGVTLCDGVPEGHMQNHIQQPLGIVDLGFSPHDGREVIRTALNGLQTTAVLIDLLLSCKKATDALREFNEGEEETLRLEFTFKEIMSLVSRNQYQRRLRESDLTVLIYKNGSFEREARLKSYVIIITHQDGQKENRNADVLIENAYPVEWQPKVRLQPIPYECINSDDYTFCA